MIENKKDQPVTSNQDGKEQESPVDQNSNQIKDYPADQGKKDERGDASKKSSEIEEEIKPTEEVIEREEPGIRIDKEFRSLLRKRVKAVSEFLKKP